MIPEETEKTEDTSADIEAEAEADTAEDATADLDIDVDVDGKYGKELSIPEEYPIDLLPVYSDADVVAVVEMSGGYTVTAVTNDDYEKVMDFYKSLLENGADVTMQAEEAGSYIAMGSIGEYNFSLAVMPAEEYEGYETQITTIVTPLE